MYDILEDYKEADTDTEKEEIFNSFCSAIWSSDNKRRIVTKTIKFKVRKDLLPTQLGQIFNTWSEVEYTSYRSITNEKDYVSLIRQKVNNIYTNLFDKRVCLHKEYFELIKTPKLLYYKWLNGEVLEPDDVTAAIDDAIAKSLQVKDQYAKQKPDLSWKDYKKLVETYFRRMFGNYMSIDDYEDKTQMNVEAAVWQEDNYCISYFTKGLDGYFKNYIKKCYGLYVPGSKDKNYKLKRCADCGGLFRDTSKTRPVSYCNTCREIRRKNTHKKYNQKRKRHYLFPENL